MPGEKAISAMIAVLIDELEKIMVSFNFGSPARSLIRKLMWFIIYVGQGWPAETFETDKKDTTQETQRHKELYAKEISCGGSLVTQEYYAHYDWMTYANYFHE